jgi:hypothetical protein
MLKEKRRRPKKKQRRRPGGRTWWWPDGPMRVKALRISILRGSSPPRVVQVISLLLFYIYIIE